MAVQKLSQIVLAGSPPASTDTIIGVGGGTTDFQYTLAQVGTAVGVPIGANPTATASNVAVNGSAVTFMRSDAAPAVQLTSSSVFGLCKVDGTTVTASGGVISSAAGGALIVGTTPISGGTAGGILYDSGPGTLQESTNLTFNGTNTIVLGGGNAIIGLFSTHNWFDGYSGNTTLTGTFNTAIGPGAEANLTTGSFNMAMGTNAMNLLDAGNSNVGIGQASLQSLAGTNPNASNNLAMGGQSGLAITSGFGNVCIGSGTLANAVACTGFGNTAIGNTALKNVTTGFNNIGIGGSALVALDVGAYNTCIGSLAGQGITSGQFNTIIGRFTGNADPITGHGNLIIGSGVGPASDVSEVIMLGTCDNGGTGTSRVDYNVTNANQWTFNESVHITGDIFTSDASFMHRTTTALTNGAGTGSGVTFTNAPGASGATGNPTKWIPIDDNGTTRYIPAF